MKLTSTAWTLLLVVVVSTLTSCSDGVEGRFVNPRNSAEYVELDGNGNWSMVQQMGGMNLPKAGEYTTHGNRVTFRMELAGSTPLHEATLDGDTLIWDAPTVGRWVQR